MKWYPPIIPAPKRWRQEGREFRVIPDYVVSSRLAWATWVRSCQTKQNSFWGAEMMGPGCWWVSVSGQCNQLAEMNIFFNSIFPLFLVILYMDPIIYGRVYLPSSYANIISSTPLNLKTFLNNPLHPVSVAHMCMMWYHPPEPGKLSVVTPAKKRVCPSHNNYVLLVIRVGPGDHPPHTHMLGFWLTWLCEGLV